MLSKRWLRLSVSLIALIILAIVLITYANSPEYVQPYLDAIIKQAPSPDYFAPDTNFYVIDIAIRDCGKWNKNSPTCGVPSVSYGEGTSQKDTDMNWQRVTKDFYLNKHWTALRYLSYKRASEHDNVIVDIAIGASPGQGWRSKGHGIWVKYGKPSKDKAITGIDLLFGEDAVEPRQNWKLIDTPLDGSYDFPIKLTYHRGQTTGREVKQLQFDQAGKLKILQVADLHFSTGVGVCRDPVPAESAEGCQADPRTVRFLESILDIEKPDFVVLTGDQIYGDEAPESESAIFKALNPFIKRKIPFAVTMGNHDHQGSLSRTQVMQLSSLLPYSLSEIGPSHIPGAGNYVLTVKSSKDDKPAATFYFVDTHAYSTQPRIASGYDWIKDEQLEYLLANKVESSLGMAFLHIPLPEYRNVANNELIGQNPETVTAPRYNTHARSRFAAWGVQVVTCGHDHANDYCLKDRQPDENDVWLCYGGGAGEGGYGGYNGYVRRVRLFELSENDKSIKTWKRREDNPSQSFDHQVLYQA
ncbi:hypothetical protein DIURU_004915 [Diutina rugosa]|uniref:Calcineurin-like phosphoesterase domain-containing protein n=1 Tax=Diutina rugosa TaxID=5481 RepID=A0A642UFK7_DIURU|nr:uncharacterized protein DIURU_004915 [Diutina rugosa]KAA8898061.1 hypothetical protein DIURU_004915 [Diutina rugosa]